MFRQVLHRGAESGSRVSGAPDGPHLRQRRLGVHAGRPLHGIAAVHHLLRPRRSAHQSAGPRRLLPARLFPSLWDPCLGCRCLVQATFSVPACMRVAPSLCSVVYAHPAAFSLRLRPCGSVFGVGPFSMWVVAALEVTPVSDFVFCTLHVWCGRLWFCCMIPSRMPSLVACPPPRSTQHVGEVKTKAFLGAHSVLTPVSPATPPALLSGSIPPQLGDLSILQTVVLARNQLSGTLLVVFVVVRVEIR